MYTRARTWKSLKAKILTAFASFALLLGAGAAVTTVAAQQENEVVETKAITTGGWTGETGSLFFVPNHTWKENNYSGNYIYPYLYIQWNSGANQNAAWPGVKWSYSSNYVYRFDNVPLTDCNQITILFNNNLKDNTVPRLDFAPASRTAWYSSSGGQTANVFGAPGDGWYTGTGTTATTMGNGLYAYSDSETLISGSIYHKDMNWGSWPTTGNILSGSSSPYSIDVDFIYGDEFKLVWYPELKYTSPSGGASSWALYNEVEWKSYSDFTFTVYDDCVSTTTAVTSANLSKYISAADGGNIKINHAGLVTISNTSKRGTAITLRWSSTSSRAFTPSTTLPGTVPGTFNSWNTSGNPISWNARTGRYETVAAVKSGDGFKFFGGDWASIATLSTDISSGATTSGGGGDDWSITSATGYYAIGWYYKNTNPSGAPAGTPQYFVDSTHYFFSNIKSSTSLTLTATALCERISIYTTCDMTNANAIALQTLYNACNYSSKSTFMTSYSISDYSYSSWYDNGKSYDGLTKDTTTNAKTKYDWLLYIGGVTNVRPAGASVIPGAPTGSESPLTMTLWIVLGAGILGLGAIGAAYFVSKKKKRHQA